MLMVARALAGPLPSSPPSGRGREHPVPLWSRGPVRLQIARRMAMLEALQAAGIVEGKEGLRVVTAQVKA